LFLPENAATKRRGYNQPPMRIRSGKVALTSKTLNSKLTVKTFFENFAARIPEKDIRGRRLRHKTGLRRFWRWSSRESAWPISQVDLGHGRNAGASAKGDATLATFLVVVPAAF